MVTFVAKQSACAAFGEDRLVDACAKCISQAVLHGHPFTLSLRHSKGMGVLGTARVKIVLQCQVQLWTVFGLAFESTSMHQRAETPPCEMHVAQVCLLCLRQIQNRQTLCCAVNILKLVTSSCKGEQ
jgi:hypothetical protein